MCVCVYVCMCVYVYVCMFVDEKDSYMYQTIGHQIVSTQPQQPQRQRQRQRLFRAPIRGLAIAKQLQYTETEGDEVEDLYILLAKVKVY